MNRYRETTSALFARFAYGLGGKRRPAVLPLSQSLWHPATQTSPIFKLPDELILSILSHISPDPWTVGHCARFRVQYGLMFDDHHEHRVRFLLRLSMTCRMMRLRLLPWIWERLEFLGTSDGHFPKSFLTRFNVITNALRADVSLGTNVKFMTVYVVQNDLTLPKLVKCLEFLPNLHTLEIGQAYGYITTALENSLKRVKLPQIKTLILPPATYPLLRHCRDVEDVVCVVRDETILSDEFLGTLASNQESKVKRLAIPLVSRDNPSRYLAALPMLTELTVLYPHPHGTRPTETEFLIDMVGTVHSAMSELINACKALPYFDTLQIVHFPFERRKQALREQVNGVKDWAIVCLKAKTGRQPEEGGGRKKTTLRVIELNLCGSNQKFCLGSAKVEECEVYESDT